MSFVSIVNGKLFVNSTLFQFVSFNIPNYFVQEDPWRQTTAYEQEDLMQSLAQMSATVARTYTFSFPNSASDSSKHIIISSGFGTSACVWTLNEKLFEDFDRGLYLAGLYRVRLIIPLIDVYSYWGGITAFANMFGREGSAFFTDSLIRRNWFLFLSMVLSRNNTVTGILYNNDPSIMGFETINEGPLGKTNWTLETARYLRTVDSNHLIIDGAYGINADVLGSDLIDIVSNHYYPLPFAASSYTTSDFLVISSLVILFIGFVGMLVAFKFLPAKIPDRLRLTELIPGNAENNIDTDNGITATLGVLDGQDRKRVVKVKTCSWWLFSLLSLASFGLLIFFVLYPILIRGLDFASRIANDCSKTSKPLLVGEMGLAPVSSLRGAIDFIPHSCSVGGLVWSLRGHSSQGGFHTHSENGGFWSYHYPGFPSNNVGFGSDEIQVVGIVAKASEQMSPAVKVAISPNLPVLLAANYSSTSMISWEGCSGCRNYTLFGYSGVSSLKVVLATGIVDNFQSGAFNYNISTISGPLMETIQHLLVGGYGDIGAEILSSPAGLIK